MGVAAKHLIIFSGLKHSGKSSLARLVSQRFGWPAQDLDVLIARLAVREHPELSGAGDHAAVVRSLYRTFGKEVFQRYEALAASEAGAREDPADRERFGILSLGGGTMENEAAMAVLGSHGMVIFLDAPCDILFERIMRGGVPAFLDPLDPRKSFQTLYQRRRTLGMAQAHQVVALGTMNLEEAYSELVPLIKEHFHVR